MLPIWVSVCVWGGMSLLPDKVTNGAFKPVKDSVHQRRKTERNTKKTYHPFAKHDGTRRPS